MPLNRAAILAATLAAGSLGAAAEPVTVRGLTFSDEHGGFELLGGWGSGSLEDPITIVEEVTATGGVVLVVRGFGPATGNPIPSAHPAGFVLRKVVINATGQSWAFYDVELQQVLGTPSDIFDGLSFGQASQVGRPFASDSFGQSVAQDEPRDSIVFFDGVVEPGERVTLTFVVTATGPMPEFYILQHPDRPVAALASQLTPARTRLP